MDPQRISSSATHAARTTASTATKAQRELKVEPVVSFEAQPRTLEVVMAEVRYGIVFGEMNEVFNRRMHGVLNFVAIAATALSGAALIGLLKQVVEPEPVTWWAIGCLALAAIAKSADIAFRFKDRASEFKAAKAAFQALEGTGWSSALNTVQKELAKLRANAPSGGNWLAPLAYNRACKELGHPEVQMSVPSGTRLASILAN